MELKPCFVVVLVVSLLAMAMAGEAMSSTWEVQETGGWVADLVEEEEMMMESETSRRTLAGNGRYISYEAMRANQVPCGHRGRSYYDCNRRGRANPYRRGCSAITFCARRTD